MTAVTTAEAYGQGQDFLATLVRDFPGLPLPTLQLTLVRGELRAFGFLKNPEDVDLWAAAACEPATSNDIYRTVCFPIAGVPLDLFAIDRAFKAPTADTYECLHCGAMFGIAGTSNGSDEDFALDEAYRADVDFHESGKCRQAAAPSQTTTASSALAVVPAPAAGSAPSPHGSAAGAPSPEVEP